GDRNGGPLDPGDEDASFKQFNPAFVSLLGKADPLSAADMQEFTDFILTVTYPPSPIANLDGTLTAAQQAGRSVFTGPITDIEARCVDCHTLPRGSSGFIVFEGEPQEFKVPHFRNLYQKIGMFQSFGDQVRGFGFLHDGSVDTVHDFLFAGVF